MSKQSAPRTPGSKRPSSANLPTIAIVAVVVVAVIVGFVAIGLLVGNGPSAANSPGSQPTNTGSTKVGHSPSTTAPTTTAPTTTTPTTTSTLPRLRCTPAPPLPKNPRQFKKPPSKTLAKNSTWRVTMTTNCGNIVMDLDGKAAPQTVSSFLFLSKMGFYRQVPCHRLTLASQGLSVLQCGDPTGTGSGGPGYGYGIENAPKNGEYPSGTVAMARTSDPNSNGSQFFIVYADTNLGTAGGGYSIFGKVVKGLDIVKAVAARGLAANGVAPKQPVSILHIAYKRL